MIEVRLSEPSDLSSLLGFDLFPGDRIVEIVERRMAVAQIAGVIVGYVAWQRQGCVGKDYVNKLVVDAAFRRRGVASLLLAYLDTVIRGRLFISTGETNTAAINLLSQSGWRRSGELAGLLERDELEVFFFKEML